MKWMDVNTGIAQVVEIGMGQLAAAEFIVEKKDLHTMFCPVDESVFQLAANIVIMHDEKLYENILLGAFDLGENIIERILTINQ